MEHHRLAIGRVPLESRRRQRQVRTIRRSVRSSCIWCQAVVSSHNRDSIYRRSADVVGVEMNDGSCWKRRVDAILVFASRTST